jgi:hypothetical protein
MGESPAARLAIALLITVIGEGPRSSGAAQPRLQRTALARRR